MVGRKSGPSSVVRLRVVSSGLQPRFATWRWKFVDFLAVKSFLFLLPT